MNGSLENSVDELTVHDASSDRNECCGNHGICSHQVLGDETPKPIANSAYKMVTRKVIFTSVHFFNYQIEDYCNFSHVGKLEKI
jgi:hypothetical protein